MPPLFRLLPSALLVAVGFAACARAEEGDPPSVEPARPATGDAGGGTGQGDGASAPDKEPGAGPVDGGDDDAPADDASPDASPPDAGPGDGAPPDAGPPDGAPPDAAAPFVAPVLDGVVRPGEYGDHTNGRNQSTTTTAQVWSVTWDDEALYVALENAVLDEALVLYLGATGAEGDGGAGQRVGQEYDGTRGSLPFAAVLAVYAKRSYLESRRGLASGWSAGDTTSVTMATAAATRELRIPWSAAGLPRRPPGFAWLGYATSRGGSVYGNVPTGNPVGSIGTNATFRYYLGVPDATPVVGSKPFAMRLP